jgi:hypothetical protein
LALIPTLESEHGTDITEGVRQLCQRAALLAAIVEDFETRWLAGEAVDLSSHLSPVGVQRRVLLSLGLHRQPRDVTPGLGDCLADRPTEPPEPADDGDAP